MRPRISTQAAKHTDSLLGQVGVAHPPERNFALASAATFLSSPCGSGVLYGIVNRDSVGQGTARGETISGEWQEPSRAGRIGHQE